MQEIIYDLLLGPITFGLKVFEDQTDMASDSSKKMTAHC